MIIDYASITVRTDPLSSHLLQQLAMSAENRLDIINSRLRHLDTMIEFMLDSRALGGKAGDIICGISNEIQTCIALSGDEERVMQEVSRQAAFEHSLTNSREKSTAQG